MNNLYMSGFLNSFFFSVLTCLSSTVSWAGGALTITIVLRAACWAMREAHTLRDELALRRLLIVDMVGMKTGLEEGAMSLL